MTRGGEEQGMERSAYIQSNQPGIQTTPNDLFNKHYDHIISRYASDAKHGEDGGRMGGRSEEEEEEGCEEHA